MSNIVVYSEQVLKQLQVLRLCLDACGKGSLLERNPYMRSPRVKRNLAALHESIEHLIQALLLFTSEHMKCYGDQQSIHSYYLTYVFLYDFNDGVKREEYDHLILIQNKEMLGKFAKLQYQSEYILREAIRKAK